MSGGCPGGVGVGMVVGVYVGLGSVPGPRFQAGSEGVEEVSTTPDSLGKWY